ncbi:MAG: hypothetical protein EB015_20520 [Methylocystaceae bacterium]|nr:hypothetical protein [Methylocystaceae bacterium]
MMGPRVLGFDPGISGGWALVGGSGQLLIAGVYPTRLIKKSGKTVKAIDGLALASLIDNSEATHAFVENVHSRPRQQGQFTFGLNAGIIHGIIYANGLDVNLVAPTSWKSVYGIKRGEDETKADKKTEARKIVQSLYPARSDLFARVMDDGAAEATLIALYGLSLILEGNGHVGH